MRRDIDVSDGQVNHIGKGFQSSKTTGAILDDFDYAVESLGHCIGQVAFNEGEDMVIMPFQSFNEFSDRFQSAFQGSRHPSLEESFSGPGGLVIPEFFEFVF